MTPETTPKPIPKRLWLAVPYGALTSTLMAGAEPGRAFRTKRDALASSRGKTAAVRVEARAAAAEGVRVVKSGKRWEIADRIAPHFLTCRDRRALKALKVDREVSAGGVIVSSLTDPRVLLMRRVAEGRVSWKTPKGHTERGESRKTTARREVREESGLRDVRVVDYLGRMQYFREAKGRKREKGALREKTVHLYLMLHRPGEADIAPREGEHFVEGAWLPFDDAIAQVTQPQARALLARADRRLAKRTRGARAATA